MPFDKRQYQTRAKTGQRIAEYSRQGLTAAAKAEEASSLLLKLGGRGIAVIDEASVAALAV